MSGLVWKGGEDKAPNHTFSSYAMWSVLDFEIGFAVRIGGKEMKLR